MTVKRIQVPAEDIPVVDESDICVIGGGCTGVFAAIRAARLGAKVTIVEKQNRFGGTATSAGVNAWHSLFDTDRKRQIIAGLTLETLQRLRKRGAATDYTQGHAIFNSEELTIELDEMIAESGINFYFHSFFSSAMTDADGKITAVVIQNKSGRQAIKAAMFIDASGDADLCLKAGYATRLPDNPQPLTMFANFCNWDFKDENPFEMIKARADEFKLPPGFLFGVKVPPSNHVYALNGTRVRDVNATSAVELSRGEMEGRRQVRALMDILRASYPESELQLCALPSQVGIRESRHIHSLCQVKGSDILYGKKFDDAVANGTYPVDTHHHDKGGITLKYLDGRERRCGNSFTGKNWEGRWRPESEENPKYYQLPLRSIIPRGAKNLICAGRMIDADSEAFAASRVMVNLNQLGEASGVTAYLALTENRDIATVDPKNVRKVLEAGGSVVL